MTLRSGETIPGELVARYDHSIWWWDTSLDVTYAIFSKDSYVDDVYFDRSFRLVSGAALLDAPKIVPVPSSQREFMRTRGFVIGRSPLDGAARVLNGNEGYHHQEGGFGDFAWDLVKTGADGKTFSGNGAKATDYHVFGEPVMLPTEGVVVDVIDSAPDNVPGVIPAGPMDEIQNNMVGVSLGGAYYLYVLHFQQGSIPTSAKGNCAPKVPGVVCVDKGARLPAGTYLGRAGNSGVTYEPHVHLTLYYYNASAAEPRSWSVPSEFENVHVKKDGAPATFAPFTVPETGSVISNHPL